MKDNKRYDRQISLAEIGEEGQKRLSEARVLVIGAGGLGCPVLQNLAAAGVGCLGIVDGDVVDESNLHRQYLYTLEDCGKPKAEVASTVILKMNPQIRTVSHHIFFTKANAASIVVDFDIIVDCTDNLPTRYLINDVAVAKGIPMVYASIHKFEGQLSVLNYKNGPTYRCLFPEDKNPNHLPDCIEGGVLGVLPNTIGILQATEILKVILGIGEVLSGKLLLYNGLKHSIHTVAFAPNLTEIAIGKQSGLAILQQQMRSAQAVGEDFFFEVLEKGSHLIIDIRESYDRGFDHSHIKNVPLADLENYLMKVNKDQKITLLCPRGHNSAMAADYFTHKGFGQISYLLNGTASLLKSKQDNDR